MRKKGIRLVVYLDDFLIMNESEEGARADFKSALDILEFLGFLINWEKSITNPANIMEYLEMVVDSNKLSFSLPITKVQHVKLLCKKTLASGTVPLRAVASILGNFTWAIPTIPFAQSHYRSMQHFYITEAKKAGGNLNVKCSLSSESRSDLEWRVFNLGKSNGKDFSPEAQTSKFFLMPHCPAGAQYVTVSPHAALGRQLKQIYT